MHCIWNQQPIVEETIRRKCNCRNILTAKSSWIHFQYRLPSCEYLLQAMSVCLDKVPSCCLPPFYTCLVAHWNRSNPIERRSIARSRSLCTQVSEEWKGLARSHMHMGHHSFGAADLHIHKCISLSLSLSLSLSAWKRFTRMPSGFQRGLYL